MFHRSSVFTNSCLKNPVDPVSKMPKTAYERIDKTCVDGSTDSLSITCSIHGDEGTVKVNEFYRSIPDYKDINHLSTEEFYSTLRSLREKKRVMLELADDPVDCHDSRNRNEPITAGSTLSVSKSAKCKLNRTLRRRYSSEKNAEIGHNVASESTLTVEKASTLKKTPSKYDNEVNENCESVKNTVLKVNSIPRFERTRRNHSACSISWNDTKRENDIDRKFDQYFEGKRYTNNTDDDFKTRSMPSSPLKLKRMVSPSRRRKSITVPKPFKMTERDEEEKVVNELRSLRKSFSADMLNQKCERQLFKANPVPIESRIPLYDKILEDQAMRRAITKINSEAELRAQMKPFSFTKREEKGEPCERAAHVVPKTKKKKRFRARPVPKNLFSNYFYTKMKEDDFFRSMNRRIRSEEMLRSASYPAAMAARDRSRLSTPAAHSDLPIDLSPAVPSTTSSERRTTSPTKSRKKKEKTVKEEFITTSPQPFRFNTADRAEKKMRDITKKIYQESKSTGSINESGPSQSRVLSALELRGAASSRSNLAALLRAETVRQKFEMETAKRLAEHKHRLELRQRDRQLRSKPAWHLVRSNHEEDIAMRLQTRRDEERMRREEFMHEMEMMYGRVEQQPMLFERYYMPRSRNSTDYLQLSSPRKARRKSLRKSYHFTSPERSRKVSINDAPETFGDSISDKIGDEEKFSDSDCCNVLRQDVIR